MILIIDLNQEKDSLHKDEFVRPVEDIVKRITTEYEVKQYTEIENLDYSHVILCGVSLKDFKYLEDLEKFNWIKDFEGSILGICAGAQIIAKEFGANLSEHKEIGLIDIEKVNEDRILEGVSLTEVYSLHKQSFSLPGNFEILLQTDIPELIKHKEKNIYACLFHPEVRNKKLIENFINL